MKITVILEVIKMGDAAEHKAEKQKQQSKQLLPNISLPLPPLYFFSSMFYLSPDQQILCSPALVELLIAVFYQG